MQRHEFQLRALLGMVVAALAVAGTTDAQLAFHNDPSQNSFSIKLPAFQQTFTRYFGNQPHGALLQQQQQQQQQQQERLQQKPYASTLQQQQSYNLGKMPLYQYQAQQQQQQHEQQPESLNRLVAQFPNQPHYSVQENYINPNVLLRAQQQRLQQQQQQQQQQYQPEPQYQGYPVQPVSGPAAQDATTNYQPQYEYIQQQQQQQQQQQAQQQQLIQQQQQQLQGNQHHGLQRTAPAQPNQQPGMLGEKLLSTAYSPSNEVSQVQFSSGSLKYNF